MSITIPVGTRIYLTKNADVANSLLIKPDTTLYNEIMYIAHDVKIGKITAIRKGTRVSGNWVTSSTPEIIAQYQSNKIYIDNQGQEFLSDSDPIRTTTLINPIEIGNADSAQLNTQYRARTCSGIRRRLVTVGCKTYPLPDNLSNFDSNLERYLNITTDEISSVVVKDLVINYF